MEIEDYIKILNIQSSTCERYMWVDVYSYGNLILSKNYYLRSREYQYTGLVKASIS